MKGSTKPEAAGHRRSSQSSLIEVTKARLTINSDGGGNKRTSTCSSLIGVAETRLTKTILMGVGTEEHQLSQVL